MKPLGKVPKRPCEGASANVLDSVWVSLVGQVQVDAKLNDRCENSSRPGGVTGFAKELERRRKGMRPGTGTIGGSMWCKFEDTRR